jgi:hypothetical protein
VLLSWHKLFEEKQFDKILQKWRLLREVLGIKTQSDLVEYGFKKGSNDFIKKIVNEDYITHDRIYDNIPELFIFWIIISVCMR